MANDKSGRSKRVNPLAIIIGLIILLVASFLGIDIEEFITYSSPEQIVEGEFVVHMIDVGQADSFLLVQDDMTALVDCGTRSTGKDAVEYIKELGINQLDYVIGTHPHEDHMGECTRLLPISRLGL